MDKDELVKRLRVALDADQDSVYVRLDHGTVRKILAALTAPAAQADAEPVAWYRYETLQGHKVRVYYETQAWPDLMPLYTAPPSGVLEGMLRAELERLRDYLTKALVASCNCYKKSHAPSVHSEYCAYRRLNEFLAMLDNSLRAEAEKLPQTHVMVPVEIIKGFVERYGDGIEVHLWLSLHKSTLEAMLRAVQEQK